MYNFHSLRSIARFKSCIPHTAFIRQLQPLSTTHQNPAMITHSGKGAPLESGLVGGGRVSEVSVSWRWEWSAAMTYRPPVASAKCLQIRTSAPNPITASSDQKDVRCVSHRQARAQTDVTATLSRTRTSHAVGGEAGNGVQDVSRIAR